LTQGLEFSTGYENDKKGMKEAIKMVIMTVSW